MYLFIKEGFISKWKAYTVVVIQIIFVILLSSRMQILIMILMIPAFLIAYYAKRKQLLRGLLYTGLILSFSILSFSILIISAPKQLIKHRYKAMFSQINSIGIDNGNLDVRKYIWDAGIDIIEKNWLFGVGSGDIKDKLLSRYSKQIYKKPNTDNLVDSTILQIQNNNKTVSYLREKAISSNKTFEKELRDHAEYVLIRKNNRYKNSLKREYNFHNQYLQTFGKIGVFGLLILCYLLAYLFILSIKRQDYLTVFFLFIVGASFLTESMLERQAGVAFFSFFYSLLIARANQNKLS
jgi:O-antigen ligase